MTLGSAHWNELWEGFSANIYYKPNISVISSIRKVFNDDLKGVKILEVGAGSGSDLIAFAQLGAKCYALDFSTAALDVCSRLATDKGVKVVKLLADCQHIPIVDGFFDLVFSVGVVEHFKSPIPILKEQLRVLKPRGLLLVDVPQKYNLYTVAKHIRMVFGTHPFGWETEYSVKELKKIGDILKLEIIGLYGRESGVAARLPINIRKYWKIIFSNLIEQRGIAPYICLHIGAIYEKPHNG